MTIERNLERIANTLELIASHIAAGQGRIAANPGAGPGTNTPADPFTDHGQPQAGATTLDAQETVIELTPAQKGAATKKANKAIKDAAAATTVAGATSDPQLTVVPGTGGPVSIPAASAPPVGIDVLGPAPAEGESPALNPQSIPTNLQEMTDYAKHVAAFLGPDVNKIGELLAGKYQVSRLPEMQIAHYTQFTADLRDLAQAKHAQSVAQ